MTNNTTHCTPTLGTDRFYCAATANLSRVEDDALDAEMSKPIKLPRLRTPNVADVIWARVQLAGYYRHNYFGELEFLGFGGWERCPQSRAYQHLRALALRRIPGDTR